MAGAQPIPDLDPAEPFAIAAAKAVAVRTAELRDHADGVLDLTDIERVHDLRVATRRLRAVLEVFRSCFPKGDYKATVASLKELADALGERRDRDVQIETLTAFAAELDIADRTGIEALIAGIDAERPVANAALAPHVEKDRIAVLAASLDQLVAAARAEGERR